MYVCRYTSGLSTTSIPSISLPTPTPSPSLAPIPSSSAIVPAFTPSSPPSGASIPVPTSAQTPVGSGVSDFGEEISRYILRHIAEWCKTDREREKEREVAKASFIHDQVCISLLDEIQIF